MKQETSSKIETRLILLLRVLGVITVVLSGGFIYFCCSRFIVFGHRDIRWEETGQVGDFVGGVIGTLVSILGFILVYLSLESQKKANIKLDNQFEKSQIESRFIELIKLHKENLYDIYIERDGKEIKNRKAIDFIVEQINACYSEIAPFFVKVKAEVIYTTEYYNKISQLRSRRKEIDLIHLAQIDIAYSIVFFGTSTEDLQSLAKLFNQYYIESFIKKVVGFIRLKPFEPPLLKHWEAIKREKLDAKMINNIITKFNKGEQITSLNELDPNYLSDFSILLKRKKGYKYYGGHQYKLGQYFRHLFQTVKYINEKKILTYDEKYAYIKALRAQLSTIEQYLIFYNSISFMGQPWELSFVKPKDDDDINEWFITKYNFIKNVPDLCLLKDVNIFSYYPDVNFEFTKEPDTRKSIIAKFI
jgi:hypothetical protein